jgi:phosphoglycerate dehydrogenase-like enzyme
MKTLLVVSFLLAALPVGTAESRDDSIVKLIADYGLRESAAPSAARGGWRSPRRIAVDADIAGLAEALATAAPKVEIVRVANSREMAAAVAVGAEVAIGRTALLCNDAVMAPATQLRWVQTVYAGVEMCVKYRDRFAREMLPLWRAANLILTPHIAGQTAAGFAVENRVIAENLRRYSAGERMLSVVDLEREY